MGDERDLMATIVAQPFSADVALLIDFADLWAIELQPQRKGFNYLRHLFIYYAGLLRMGVAVNLVPYSADLSPYRLVIAPTIHMPDASLADRLTHCAHAGGTVLLGIRSGFKTTTNLVTDQPLPGLLRELAGVKLTTWQSLPDGVGVPLTTELEGLTGSATIWYETLLPESAVPLGHYALVT